MLEKDNISMATVQIKPEYAASEVYSTTSEAPPLGFLTYTTQQAYKRQSNSVKIAKITAFTIIVSSFVLGSFILASSYLQAKASCDQVQALDSVLEKELMLETLQQVNKELPRAEALMGKEVIIDADLQNLDKKEQPIIKKEVKQTWKSDTGESATEVSNEVDNNYTDSEEAIDLLKYSGKVPLELDLSELAAALLQSNKKSSMNCVVERKHAEEIVDSPSKMVSLPFGMNLKTDPKKARITGERISIFCEGGNENKETKENRESNNDDDTEEDAGANVRPIFIPYQRLPTLFGQIPQQFPLTHMPQRMIPPMSGGKIPQQPFQHPLIGQSPTFQQVPMRTHMSPPMIQSPNSESQQQTLRIHVQQIPFREIHMAEDLPMHIPSQHQELPHFQIQRVPLDLALQRAGITADDLQKIQRMAEDRITDEFRRFVAEEDVNAGAENNNSSEEDDLTDLSSPQNSGYLEQLQRQQQNKHIENHYSIEQTKRLEKPQQIEQNVIQRLILQKLPEQPRETMTPPIPDQPQPMLHFGRDAFGRSLAQPVRIPVPMMQAQADLTQDVAFENRRNSAG